MTKYIDADKLVEEIACKAKLSPMVGMVDMEQGYQLALICVKNAPAADVAEVRHARWEHLDDDWFDLWRCTACGETWTFEYDPTNAETNVKYCPNCGAKMDKKEDE